MAWAPDYVTLGELKAYLRLSDTVDDLELPALITAASRAVDSTCNRQFGSLDVPGTFYYSAEWSASRGQWIIYIDDLQDVTGLAVTVDDVAVTAPGYVLLPRGAAAKGRPYEAMAFTTDAESVPCGALEEVAVSADAWGWAAVPEPVAMATKIQSGRFSVRRDSPYGVAGSPDGGTEIRLLARVDPDVAVALADYVRPRRPG